MTREVANLIRENSELLQTKYLKYFKKRNNFINNFIN